MSFSDYISEPTLNSANMSRVFMNIYDPSKLLRSIAYSFHSSHVIVRMPLLQPDNFNSCKGSHSILSAESELLSRMVPYILCVKELFL